jgi:Helix-turn-helix domain
VSWELTKLVLSHTDLDPTERAVAHCLAFHAPRNGSAYPSMTTIALESGLADRQSAQRVVRRLERKGIVFAVSPKKGGRNNPTRYQFASKKSIPPDAVSSVKCIPGGPESASLDTLKCIPPDARDRRETEERDSALALDLPSEMEEKIWRYYLQCVKPGNNYSLTISRKRMLADRYREMIAKGQSPEESSLHLAEAVAAFSEDDFHMGRKKGYEGAGRKGLEQIFRTQDVFEDWCAKYAE